MATKNCYKIDSYDKLYIKCDGATTSFVDSATAKAITANGNATQLTIPEAFGGKRTAGFFNGTTDYVVVPDSDDWDFGTGDFEIQFYVNVNAVGNNTPFVDNGGYASGVYAQMQNSTTFRLYCGGQNNTWSWSPSTQTWYKIKVARISSVVTFYVNDIAQGSPWGNNGNITGLTNGVLIGKEIGASNYLSGWLKNLTITKAGSTVLNMKFDSPATSPISPAIYFDGTGDYLSLADSADWDIGTNHTIETFFQWTTVANSTIWSHQNSGNPDNHDVIWLRYASGSLIFDNYTSYFGYSYISKSFTPVANKWYHIAMVKTGTSYELFVDGKSIGTNTQANLRDSYDGVIRIGCHWDSAFQGGITGNMREFRISNTNRYTTAFTPSQRGFTVDSNTKLYIKGNADNGTATVFRGGTVTASAQDYGAASNLFLEDGSTSSWYTNVSFPAWVKYDFGVGVTKTISSYRVQCNDATVHTPKTWTVEGSNNDSTWTVLDTMSDSTGLWGGNTGSFVRTISSPAAYRYYKINVTATISNDHIQLAKWIGYDSTSVPIVDSETSPKAISIYGNAISKYTEDYRSCIFKDETGKFPYPQGSAKVDFFSAFGSGVGYFGDSATGENRCTALDSADFDFGTGDFTAEYYIRWLSLSRNDYIIGKWLSNSGWTDFYNIGAALQIYDDTAHLDFTPSFFPIVNQWYHIAWCRSGNNMLFAINGVASATQSCAGKNYDGATTTLGFGGARADTMNTKLMDNIRISKGIARYTATFNPPEIQTYIPKVILI